jgi:hypothetical protein
MQRLLHHVINRFSTAYPLSLSTGCTRHCEARLVRGSSTSEGGSDEAIQFYGSRGRSGLLRGVCHRAGRSLSSGADSRGPLAPTRRLHPAYAPTRPRGATNATRTRGWQRRDYTKASSMCVRVQKYFHSRLTQINSISLGVSSPSRGVSRSSRTRAGCGGRGQRGLTNGADADDEVVWS